MTSATTLAGTRPASRLVCQESGSKVTLHSRRHLQCGKDLLPSTPGPPAKGECTGQQQSRLGLRSRRATHGPMATEGEPHFAALPRTNAFLGVMQEREESAAGEGHLPVRVNSSGAKPR